jgi:type I restriction enzyme S subunit
LKLIFSKICDLKTRKVKVGSLGLKIADFVSNGSFADLKENTKVLNTEDYAFFIRNTDLKTFTFERFVSKRTYEYLSNSALFGGELLISNVGDVGSVYLCPRLTKPMTLGNNMILVSFPHTKDNHYLYMLFRSEYGQNLLDGITCGSAQLKFNKTDFKSLVLDLPSEEIVSNFNDGTNCFFEIYEKDEKKIAYLKTVRFNLLNRYFSSR